MINWDSDVETLVAETRQAITRFVEKFPSARVCSVFSDADPLYGYVMIAFDTIENSLRSCREQERWAVERRQRMLADGESWRNASYFLTAPPISTIQSNSGDFEHPQFAEILFPEWQRVAESNEMPEGMEGDDHWLAGNVRILLWRAGERLVDTGTFDVLNQAPPCVLGYGLHDEEEGVLRVLRWPDDGARASGPRGLV